MNFLKKDRQFCDRTGLAVHVNASSNSVIASKNGPCVALIPEVVPTFWFQEGSKPSGGGQISKFL